MNQEPNIPWSCPRCGSPVGENDTFCGECGADLRNMGAWSAGSAYPVPDLTAPLSTVDYLLMLLLFSVPLAGGILMLIWSFMGNINVNRQNFSRAMLIVSVVSIAASLIFAFLIYSLLDARTGF